MYDSRCRLLLLLSILFFWMPTPCLTNEPTPEQLAFFESKIRPLFAENCNRCHSSAQKQRGGLMLDNTTTMLQGGDTGPAIVPNDPDKSLLIKAVRYTNPDLQMPPRGKLSAQQIKDLESWVKMGAPWPKTDKIAKKINADEFDLKERSKYWSFQPMTHPDIPVIENKEWPLTAIDHFILNHLEQAGLTPSSPANKRTLIRRVYIDLIGLPPTPEEVDAFLQDDSPKAYEKVVEKLLASSHYGERWGRHWLDLVRYAETQGHEFDFEMHEPWRYRDYVIRAFNNDVPYNQFVKEHIAGDLLPNPRWHANENFNESVLGTGFWFLGEAKHSPVDVKGDQSDRIDNQIDVFSKTFLGMTLACAKCHDHKFDPIRTDDYYAIAGYLQSSRYQHAFINDPAPTLAKIAKLKELQTSLEKLVVPTVSNNTRQRLQLLEKFLGTDGNDDAVKNWQTLARKEANTPLHPLHVFVAANKDNFSTVRQRLAEQHRQSAGLDDRYTVFADFRKQKFDDWFVTGQAFGDGPSGGERTVFQANAQKPVQKIIAANSANSGLVADQLQGVLRSPTFTIDKDRIHFLVEGRNVVVRVVVDGLIIIRNPIYGGLQFTINHGDGPRWHNMNVSMWKGHRAYIEIKDDGNGSAALHTVAFSNEPGAPNLNGNLVLADMLANKANDNRRKLLQNLITFGRETLEHWEKGTLANLEDRSDRVALLNWMLTSPEMLALPVDQPKTSAQDQVVALLQSYDAVAKQIPAPVRAIALADGSPINEHVFIRGSHKNLGDTVPRRFFEVFVGKKDAVSTGSGRLQLAEEIVSPENPLTARVMVNRIWKHHFGEGLVKSVDNFGLLGEQPSHPQLLDWLATEFIRRNWSIKDMHRLMVLSRTYQMTSHARADAKTKDPTNKLLHRMPIKRMEGEIIRDSLLALSGRLDKTMGGPGVMPHLTPFMSGRGRPGRSGPLDGAGRRSVYINVRRNFLTPMFLVFDYPTPFTTIGRRSVSNVPAQALTMMNNPFILQQCESWAKKILAQPGKTNEQRIELMFQEALSRPPQQREIQQMLNFLRLQNQVYGMENDPRSWRDLCHVVVNLKEFIYVN